LRFLILGLLIAFGLALAACGLAELFTGWVLPAERGRVLHPRPHGLGLLTVGSGFSIFTAAATWAVAGGACSLALLVAGIGLILAGNILLACSRHGHATKRAGGDQRPSTCQRVDR
jgi:hypothetical protein